MLADEKPVAWNQRCGFKAKPTVPLYTRPAPAAPQAEPETFESELRSFAETPEQVAFVEKLIAPQTEPCIGNDPACPCQDGDPCHYRDTATTKAWPIPQAEQERPQIEVSLAAGLGYWGIALCVGAQSFALLAEFATLTEAEEYAERLRAALGITGDSDADQ